MAKQFRENHPSRQYKGNYANYRSYKPHLAADFSNRCGYTDCPDFWFGGTNNFHIDHFIPWKTYPDTPKLKTDYQNLIYCCSYVNILKSNDEGDYIDPCNEDFNNHFSRDDLGNIIPNPQSVQAKYMYKKLRLFMRRYQIIWMLDSLFTKLSLLKRKIEGTDDSQKKKDLLSLFGELSLEMMGYLEYLKKNQ
jgi:hypothetical protein